jgi:hypothetical protein
VKTCICNKCSTEILINIQETIIDQDEDGKDIIEQFFLCPECGQRYTFFISDSFMRKKIVARKRLQKHPMQYNPVLDTALVKEMQKHFKELKVRYGRE